MDLTTISKWGCWGCEHLGWSLGPDERVFCRLFNIDLKEDSYCPYYKQKSKCIYYKNFKGSSIYLTKKEKCLIYKIMKDKNLEDINDIYWDDYRNILEKLNPEL